MPDAVSFLADLEAKENESVQRITAANMAVIAAEGFQGTDVLRLEMRSVIEAVEVAALWVQDSDSLEVKMGLAARCGDGARHLKVLGDRLGALGQPPAGFDPRQGGYSKLFAFFRSLQTTAERTAGFLAQGAANVGRMLALAGFFDDRGDAETARLYREQLLTDERRYVLDGRQALLEILANEESQTRARRASFRAMELFGEIQDGALMRRFLTRSVRK